MNKEIIDNKNGNELKIKLVGKLDTNTSPQLEEFIQNNIEDIEKLIQSPYRGITGEIKESLKLAVEKLKEVNDNGEINT